jgi:hypothetical protein
MFCFGWRRPFLALKFGQLRAAATLSARWVIAASSSVAIAHAALDVAIANYPGERFTLRNGILVIRRIRTAMSRTVIEARSE